MSLKMDEKEYVTLDQLAVEDEGKIALKVQSLTPLATSNCGDVIKLTNTIQIAGCIKSGIIEFAKDGTVFYSSNVQFDSISYLEYQIGNLT